MHRRADRFALRRRPTSWQDVRFGVVTGQSYWDLDRSRGISHLSGDAKVGTRFSGADRRHRLSGQRGSAGADGRSGHATTGSGCTHCPGTSNFIARYPGYWEVDDHDSWINDGWPTANAPWMNPLTFEQGFDVYREQVPMGDLTVSNGSLGQRIADLDGRRATVSLAQHHGRRSGEDDLGEGADGVVETNHPGKRCRLSSVDQPHADRRTRPRTKGRTTITPMTAFAHEGNEFRSWTKESGAEELLHLLR